MIGQAVVPPILFASVIYLVAGATATPTLTCARVESLRQDLGARAARKHFDPPALLPVGHSPSRRCHQRRWWSLEPPFQPLPRLRTAGMLSVAVVVILLLLVGCPDLLFRQATLPRL